MFGAVAIWKWVLAGGFVVGSAFCSGTETALTALGDNRARQLRASGTRGAQRLALWVDHPERVLSTLLIGNTLLNVGAGALAGEIADDLARAAGWSEGSTVAAVTAAVTLAVLFLGEIVPKTFAKRHPVSTSMSVLPWVVGLTYVMWPVTSAVGWLTRHVVSLLGSKDGGPAVTSEEIEYLIEVGTREGVLDEVKEELLNSVLEFADRVVKEIMVPRTRMVALDLEATPEELVRVVTENPYSRMPVFHGSVDEIVGILLVREIIQDVKGAPQKPFDLRRRMKPVYFVPETMKISRLLKEMQRRKTHLAVVVDEFGGTSGLVTLEDVLEEIVGEIQDEADAEASPFKAIGPGTWLAEAAVPLHDLEAWLEERLAEGLPEDAPRPDITFPDADYETLGGFVTARAGRVPPVGAAVSFGGFTFTVRAGDERRVSRVEIAREAAPATGAPPGAPPVAPAPRAS
ncbi:MAG: hemolysin family protein [Anaeromyxobacter sp.]